MTEQNHGRKQRRIIALVMLLTILMSALFPVAAQARTVKAKTSKGTYTIENALRGIDVSKWNGSVNWKNVAKDNVDFAFARATYGTDPDATFVTNAKGAYDNGIHIGAYHYARFKTSAGVKQEAAAFLKQIKKVTLTYPVVLDIENHYKLSKTKLTNLALEFCEILEEAGYKVIVYTYQNFFTGHLNVSKLEGYNLWVANYVQKPSGLDYVCWQHSNTGKVSGIKGAVDLNVAMKSLAVKKLPGKSTTTTPTSSSSDGEQDTTPMWNAANSTKPVITDAVRQSIADQYETPDTTPPKSTGTSKTATTKEPAIKVPTSQPTEEGSKTAARTGTLSSSDDAVVRLIGKFFDSNYKTDFANISALNKEDMDDMLNHAFQIEVNKQLGGKVPLNGQLSDNELIKLAEVKFTLNKTQGRITTLIQGKLYAMDYLDMVNGKYDSDMVSAIRALQSDGNLEPTGQINTDTWRLILGL